MGGLLEQFDTLIRGAAIGVTLFVCVRLLIARWPDRKALAVSSLGVTIACYLLVSSPFLTDLNGPVLFVLVAGAILTPIALVWAVFEIFHDRPTGHWPWLGLAALTAAAGFASVYEPRFDVVRAVLVGVLYLGVIVIAVVSDPDDLVPERRRFRRAFVVAMALLGVAITATELLVDPKDVPPVLLPLQAACILILSAAFGVWTLQPTNPLWPAPQPVAAPSPARTGLVDRLALAMDDGAWRTEGLTIGALAAQLDVPEHRLRTAINRELGFRNFSAFINSHRIRAACAALSDPAREGATVLEIAYESGFSSLGPFNRAFRAETGQSPTEYRQSGGAGV